VLLGLAVWNQLFMFQYWHGLIERDRAIGLAGMVTQKFELTSTWSAHRQGRASAISYQRRDMPAFAKHAREAYRLAPEYAGSRAIYALWCLRAGIVAECRPAFEEWLKDDPTDFLTRWGLAEMRLRAGDRKSAAALLSTPDAAEIPADALSKITGGSKSIMDEELHDRSWGLAGRIYFNRARREY
jgi:hypothetical protein